jgi:hypothetical protein
MRNERTYVRVAILCSAGSLLACSGAGNVDIGNTSVVGARLSDYAASWDGYAQAYTFSPDGSDRVRLKIDASGHGTLQVGDAAVLPPPTDPDVGFPSGVRDYPDPTTVLAEGFLYPTYAAQVQSARVQVGINPNDLEAAWCALQTPYPLASGITLADGGGHFDYTCTPTYTLLSPTPGSASCSYSDGQGHSVDCDKFYLCQDVFACDCIESTCTGRQVPTGTPVGQYPIELDAALDATGTTLTGTLNLNGTRVTVVMQKQ